MNESLVINLREQKGKVEIDQQQKINKRKHVAARSKVVILDKNIR